MYSSLRNGVFQRLLLVALGHMPCILSINSVDANTVDATAILGFVVESKFVGLFVATGPVLLAAVESGVIVAVVSLVLAVSLVLC